MNFASCLLIINPGGSQVDLAKDHIKQLHDYFKDTITVHELTGADFDTPKRIQDRLNDLAPESLIIIVGGDGTVNMVINQLLSSKASDRSTVLPLWAGNANDIAHMLNGPRHPDIIQLINIAKRKQAHALRIDIDGQGEHKSMHSLAYFSIGATGSAMRAIEKRKHKTNLLAEALTGIVAMLKTDRFRATVNGHTGFFFELAYLNGSRIAKLYKTPSKLSRKGITQLTLIHKHPVVIGHIIALLLSHIRHNQQLSLQTIHIEDETLAQLDGETIRLKAASTITIEPASSSYYVLTLKD